MSAIDDIEPTPEPPPILPRVAAALECTMLFAFMYAHGAPRIVGVLAWFAYLWFSATLGVLTGRVK